MNHRRFGADGRECETYFDVMIVPVWHLNPALWPFEAQGKKRAATGVSGGVGGGWLAIW
jgi:hypothetical protein